MPRRRSTIRYSPVSSLTTERTFSINTGLAASTITPGSTAPAAYMTTPVMADCANAVTGRSTTTNRAAADRLANGHIVFLLTWGGSTGDENVGPRARIDTLSRPPAETTRRPVGLSFDEFFLGKYTHSAAGECQRKRAGGTGCRGNFFRLRRPREHYSPAGVADVRAAVVQRPAGL